MRFRQLRENRFDPRPENRHPADVAEMLLVSHIGTQDNWREWRELLLKRETVYRELEPLMAGANDGLPAIRYLRDGYRLSTDSIEPLTNHCITARAGLKHVGRITLKPSGSSALLRSLAVAPEHRRRSYGRGLCAKVISHPRRGVDCHPGQHPACGLDRSAVRDGGCCAAPVRNEYMAKQLRADRCAHS